MHVIEFPELGVTKYLPEDLSECDPRQYIEACALIYAYHIGQVDYETMRVHMLYKLLPMKAKHPDRRDDFKSSKVWQLSQLIDSFFETNEEGQSVIKQYYIHNPIPTILGVGVKYYGPANDFDNACFGEYTDALEAFLEFTETGENAQLYRLAATLYRPSAWLWHPNDRRRKYEPAVVPARARRLENQHIGIVYGIYLWFASFQKYLSTAKLYIGGNEIDFSVLFEKPKSEKAKSKIPGIGMKGIEYALAESGVYGTVQGVRKAGMWDVFVYMHDLIKRAADQEAEYKAATKKSKSS